MKKQKWFDEYPPWGEMDEAQRKEFCRRSWVEHCREEYENSLTFLHVDGPPWDELTQEQKDGVGDRIKENAKEMQKFGESLKNNN